MVETKIVITVIVFVIFSVVWLYFGYENKKVSKKFERYLKTLKSFELDLDTIKIDGFHWRESIPVDAYDNQLNPYEGTGSFSKKFHKQKNVTKFRSKLYIPINYLNKEIHYTMNLPFEHTHIRMKFYLRKKATVYVDKLISDDSDAEERLYFLLDFRFLKNSRNYIFSTEPVIPSHH